MYTYQCNTIRVIDGNTVDATIDLGFNVTIRQRIKLYGVNVKDIHGQWHTIKDEISQWNITYYSISTE